MSLIHRRIAKPENTKEIKLWQMRPRCWTFGTMLLYQVPQAAHREGRCRSVRDAAA